MSTIVTIILLLVEYLLIFLSAFLMYKSHNRKYLKCKEKAESGEEITKDIFFSIGEPVLDRYSHIGSKLLPIAIILPLIGMLLVSIIIDDFAEPVWFGIFWFVGIFFFILLTIILLILNIIRMRLLRKSVQKNE